MKIEQAREVSARIWNAGYTDESATIDALIAELEKVTREAHENKDKARWANAELERIKSQEPVAWMTQSGNPVLYKSAEQAVLYGWNPLFLAAGAQVQAQPVQQEPSHYVDDHGLLYTAARVKFLGLALEHMRPLYEAPVQAQERKPLTFDQIENIWVEHGLDECDCHGFARAIEAAHGIAK